MVRALAGLLGVLIAAPAVAKEYRLDPVASGASIDGVVYLAPIEIDVTRPDYVLIVSFRNDSEQAVMMRLNEFRCLRGSEVYRPYDDNDTEWIHLRPFEVRTRQFVCDHGPYVTGDFGLMIRRIVTNPYGDQKHPGEALVEDVVWRLREADVTWDQQTSGRELGCLQYRRPPHRVLADAAPIPSCDCSKICGIEGSPAEAPAEAVAPATLLAPLAPAPTPPPAPRPPPPAATLRPR